MKRKYILEVMELDKNMEVLIIHGEKDLDSVVIVGNSHWYIMLGEYW